MFWKKEKLFTASQDEVMQSLDKSLARKSYVDSPNNRFFQLRSVANLALRQYFQFRFSGDVSQKDEHTVLTYTVRPVLPICILWLIFLLTTIKGWVDVMFSEGSMLFAAVGLVVTIFLYAVICTEGKTCIDRFEKELSQAIENRGECS